MRKKKIAQIKELYHNPGKSADYIGLRYSLDSEPGYTRKKHGTGFTYKTPDGKTVKDSKLKKYFKTLVIPPAWTDVWINPHKNGHILVTGRDADGRKQYMYHPKWQELRTKLNSYRMIDFAEQLPKIRHKVANEINKKGLSEDKISALIVYLLDKLHIRIGSEKYAVQHHSYGLTTLRDNHVQTNGNSIKLQFRAKSGKQQTYTLENKTIARLIEESEEIPGSHLFQYYDENGNHHAVTADHINAFLKDLTASDFTAKDFRTWAGTSYAHKLFSEHDEDDFDNPKKLIPSVVKVVAEELGNTPAVCRKNYISPELLASVEDGTYLKLFKKISERKLISKQYFPIYEQETKLLLEEFATI